MPQSVFAGGQSYNGGFRADQLELNFGGGTDDALGDGVSGYLVQNVQFSYTQQVTTLYEIGSSNLYYVGGRAQGTATLARVIGPSPLAKSFIKAFNDICSPEDITFNAGAGCFEDGANGETLNYTLQDAVLTTISTSVTAQDVVINEQMQFIFADLEYEDSSP